MALGLLPGSVAHAKLFQWVCVAQSQKSPSVIGSQAWLEMHRCASVAPRWAREARGSRHGGRLPPCKASALSRLSSEHPLRGEAIWPGFPPASSQPARQLWNPSKRICSALLLARLLPPPPPPLFFLPWKRKGKKKPHPVLGVHKPRRGCKERRDAKPGASCGSIRLMSGRGLTVVAVG